MAEGSLRIWRGNGTYMGPYWPAVMEFWLSSTGFPLDVVRVDAMAKGRGGCGEEKECGQESEERKEREKEDGKEL